MKRWILMVVACALNVFGGQPKNVLLLCVDDLRPVMGCYGGAAKTPNLDRLAEQAAVFTRHYVQWPVCGPSRASMLGGLRPDTSGLYEIADSSQIADRPDTHPTMPLWFKEHGYTTLSFGKVYHHNGTKPGYGWSRKPWSASGHWTCYINETARNKGKVGPVYEIFQGSEKQHNDYQMADQVIRALGKYKDKPFFIAGGFLKPHLPLVAPRAYYDLYDKKEIKQLDPMSFPVGAADYMYKWTELKAYSDPEGNYYGVNQLPDADEALKITRAYYACVSFVDAQIGKVLDALDQLGLADSTAVVIWGDHGFHLGDHNRWAKHTQFEQAMRSPLMVRLPKLNKISGETQALVESVDLYPTLCEWAGIETPAFVEGRSLLPVLTGKPDNSRIAAFSQIQPVNNHLKNLMAYSVRSKDYRYVEWRDSTKGGLTVFQELYDHRNDPEETINVAGNPEYSGVLKDHQALLLKQDFIAEKPAWDKLYKPAK